MGYDMYDKNGNAVLSSVLKKPVDASINEFYPRLDNVKFGLLETTITNPAKWSTEEPNLYTLVLSLEDSTGNLLEAKSCKLGFRSIEFAKDNSKLLINGKLTYIYGVNRPDHHPIRGKALTREDILQDVQTIKRFNFNCIRLSHYPSDPYLLDLCDQYGIMDIDEANLETHGLGSKLSNDPAWTAAYLERSSRMALRDKNHSSIIFWSLGNEAGRGPNHAAMAAWLHDFDITRPIHYEPAMGSPKEEGYMDPSNPKYLKPNDHSHRIQNPLDQYYVDMVSRMYPAMYTAELLASQPNGDRRPIFFCEYAHAMGNSAGNLKDFWDQWRKTDRVIGGCIWEFKDQGLLKKDSVGVEFYAYGGDYGEKYYDEFTIKGVVNADGKPKGAMYECKHVFQPISCEWDNRAKYLVKIINRGSVNNTNQYQAELIISKDGKIISTKALSAINLEAGKETILDITSHIPKMDINGEYFATIRFSLLNDVAWTSKGFIIASDQLELQSAATRTIVEPSANKLVAKEDSDNISISGKSIAVKFNKQNGALYSYVFKGKEQIKAPLLPHFTRPLTDNDRRGWKPQRKLRQWYESPLKLISTAVATAANHTTITSNYSLIHDSANVVVTYKIKGDGTIKVNYLLDVKPGLPNIPKVGMQIGIERNYDQIQWYGKGPMENYIDKNSGFEVGIYQLPINDFMENYVIPQENGNRTDVRWMQLSEKQNKNGLLVIADSLLSMNAWPYTEQNIQTAKHTNKLKDTGYITLNIDLVQMGVGGNDSWSDVAAPLDKYQIKAQPYSYSFYLLPYEPGKSDINTTIKKIKFK